MLAANWPTADSANVLTRLMSVENVHLVDYGAIFAPITFLSTLDRMLSRSAPTSNGFLTIACSGKSAIFSTSAGT
ncbi:MAG TPA: hypothetical protein VF505_14455 [Thermoanaerobaculia bacterium]